MLKFMYAFASLILLIPRLQCNACSEEVALGTGRYVLLCEIKTSKVRRTETQVFSPPFFQQLSAGTTLRIPTSQVNSARKTDSPRGEKLEAASVHEPDPACSSSSRWVYALHPDPLV